MCGWVRRLRRGAKGGGHQRGEVRCRLAHAQGTARRSAVSSPPAEATAGRCAWNTPAPATFEVVQWLEDACVASAMRKADVIAVAFNAECARERCGSTKGYRECANIPQCLWSHVENTARTIV